MPELVTYSIQQHVAVITIDNPPVNALSAAVASQIEASIHRARTDAMAHAIVIIGAGATFIAGANITEFSKIVSGELPA